MTYDAAVADPVGLSDIDERLGMAKGTAKHWNLRKLLPPPKWTVSGRPAWEWRDVEKWASKTGRLRTPEE